MVYIGSMFFDRAYDRQNTRPHCGSALDVDDQRRGGDIDLAVQKIDLVLASSRRSIQEKNTLQAAFFYRSV